MFVEAEDAANWTESRRTRRLDGLGLTIATPLWQQAGYLTVELVDRSGAVGGAHVRPMGVKLQRWRSQQDYTPLIPLIRAINNSSGAVYSGACEQEPPSRFEHKKNMQHPGMGKRTGGPLLSPRGAKKSGDCYPDARG